MLWRNRLMATTTLILSERCAAAGIDPETPAGSRLCHLVDEILGFPRHLSQHVGGMVITQGKFARSGFPLKKRSDG